MDRILRLHWFGGPVNPGEVSSFNDNQLFTLIILVALIFIISILIFVAIKRQKVDKAPNTVVLMVESIIKNSDEFISETHGNKFDKMNPYFISLFAFLILGNMLSLVGLAPIGTGLSAIFAATVISWLGTHIIGFIYKKFKYLFKILNPLEASSNFSPLISLTFRMYGNILGGVVLVALVSLFLNNIWTKIIGANLESPSAELNPIGLLILPAFNLYFDIFDSFIQAFVFMILTISYWTQSAEEDIKEKHKDKIKEWKQEILKNKQNKNNIDNKNNETSVVEATI